MRLGGVAGDAQRGKGRGAGRSYEIRPSGDLTAGRLKTCTNLGRWTGWTVRGQSAQRDWNGRLDDWLPTPPDDQTSGAQAPVLGRRRGRGTDDHCPVYPRPWGCETAPRPRLRVTEEATPRVPRRVREKTSLTHTHAGSMRHMRRTPTGRIARNPYRHNHLSAIGPRSGCRTVSYAAALHQPPVAWTRRAGSALLTATGSEPDGHR